MSRRTPPPRNRPSRSRRGLSITRTPVHEHLLLTIYGTLDATTYLRIRDAVIQAAARHAHGAIIIDLTWLTATSPAAWSLLTGFHDEISQWTPLPIQLVCDCITGQKRLRDHAGRELPLYWDVQAAIAALPAHTPEYRTSQNPPITPCEPRHLPKPHRPQAPPR
jgi:hypothetical protein